MDQRTRRRRTYRVRVRYTAWLTPHMLRVVVGGEGLAGFADNGCTDCYVKVLFPVPGVTYPDPFDLDVVHRELPRACWPKQRTYTVRRFDADAGELTIDFVYHGEHGLGGPWAVALRPGDEFLLAGPGGAYAPSTAADWHLLVGDESALPAIGATLAALPEDAVARAFVLVQDAADEQKLTVPTDTEITWLHRADVPYADIVTAGRRLVHAVRALSDPPGQVQAFVHGEAGFVMELRRYLLHERQVPDHLLSISGYWRHGKNDEGWRAEKAVLRQRERQAAGLAG